MVNPQGERPAYPAPVTAKMHAALEERIALLESTLKDVTLDVARLKASAISATPAPKEEAKPTRGSLRER